jgi:predicted dithiol-disulfide oxidoreductase (DUF899 family)
MNPFPIPLQLFTAIQAFSPDRPREDETTAMFSQTNLEDESENYKEKREELRLAEIELMQQRERVAEMRRALPRGAAVEDYVFDEVPLELSKGDDPVTPVRLSELFSAPDRPLILYHLMFGKKQTRPCPMCTMWIDGLNGVADHVSQNADLAIVAAADPLELRSFARSRGWNRLRLLSCGTNSFKHDLKSEDDEGRQDSTISVFTKDPDGTVRHFYTAHPSMAEDIHERGIDLLTPVYNLLDLTPNGRGSWYASLKYPAE